MQQSLVPFSSHVPTPSNVQRLAHELRHLHPPYRLFLVQGTDGSRLTVDHHYVARAGEQVLWSLTAGELRRCVRNGDYLGLPGLLFQHTPNGWERRPAPNSNESESIYYDKGVANQCNGMIKERVLYLFKDAMLPRTCVALYHSLIDNDYHVVELDTYRSGYHPILYSGTLAEAAEYMYRVSQRLGASAWGLTQLRAQLELPPLGAWDNWRFGVNSQRALSFVLLVLLISGGVWLAMWWSPVALLIMLMWGVALFSLRGHTLLPMKDLASNRFWTRFVIGNAVFYTVVLPLIVTAIRRG